MDDNDNYNNSNNNSNNNRIATPLSTTTTTTSLSLRTTLSEIMEALHSTNDDDDDDDTIPLDGRSGEKDHGIVELIRQKQWDTLRKQIITNPSLSLWTDEHNSRTALHYLFRCKFPSPHLKQDSDINEDDDDNKYNPLQNSEIEYQLHQASKIIQLFITTSCDKRTPPVVLPQDVYIHDGEEEEDGFITQDADFNTSKVTTAKYALHTCCLTIQDYLGNTPLHTLIAGGYPSMHFVTAFFDLIHPYSSRCRDDDDDDDRRSLPTATELLSTKNMHGCTPLHFLAEGRIEFEVAEFILQQISFYSSKKGEEEKKKKKKNPLLIPDEDGDIPLHYVCSGGLEPKWLQLFLKYSVVDADVDVEELLQKIKINEDVHVQNLEGSLPVDELITWYVDTNGWIEENDGGGGDNDEYENYINMDDDGHEDSLNDDDEEEVVVVEEELGENKMKTKEQVIKLFEKKWRGLWPQLEVILRAACPQCYHHLLPPPPPDDYPQINHNHNNSNKVSSSLASSLTVETSSSSSKTVFLPLHAAASIHWFPSIILRIATVLFPDQISRKDNYFGMLPLHVACMDDDHYYNQGPNSAPRTIYALQRIDTYPELVRWGMNCTSDNDDDDDDVVDDFSNDNISSSNKNNNNIDDNIFLPSSLSSSSSMIQFLLSLYPEAAKIEIPVLNHDKKECQKTIFDNKKSTSKQNLKEEKERKDEQHQIKTRLPLHLALEGHRASMQDIQSLLCAYPDALTIKDGKTGLYPFMIAAAISSSTPRLPSSSSMLVSDEKEEMIIKEEEEEIDDKLDICFEMLRLDPELVRSGCYCS